MILVSKILNPLNPKLMATNTQPLEEIEIQKVVVKLCLSGRVLLQKDLLKLKLKQLKQYAWNSKSQTKNDRLPKFNKNELFNEITNSLDKISNNYENILHAEDLNIESQENTSASSQLFYLTNVFNLENIMKENTRYKSKRGTLIDIVLKNKPRSFQKPQNFEIAGISDCHKLIVKILRSSFKKLQPKIVSFSSFDEKQFLSDLTL